jgi:glyoxylase-like metal-dependent hydrolase (beta-lactamase superfamily II)
VRTVAPGISLIDVHFQGHPDYIACYVLETGSGVALVDPGPTSTLPALEEGLRLAGLSLDNVEALLLTHIHLDHAGAAGTIVARNPQIDVYVHARGARHMISPGRLLASAERLYGDRMQQLWGEFLAVPEDRIRQLEGGESLRIGGRELAVAYTPGHAVHHVSYYDDDSGVAFVGDTCGIRISNGPYVLPVTPPPDIDLEAWERSIATIRGWEPDILCPTHFGPARPVTQHLNEHERRLRRWAQQVSDDLDAGRDADQAARRFADEAAAEITAALSGDTPLYLRGGGVTDSWHGLARYWKKRARMAAS